MKSKHLLLKSADENDLGLMVKEFRPRKRSFKPKPPDKPKTRKELRKELRKNKKLQKHTYILGKYGKTLPEEQQGKKKKRKRNRKRTRGGAKIDLEETELDKNKDKVEDVEPGKYVKIRQGDLNSKREFAQKNEDDQQLAQLKIEMEEIRKRRMIEENTKEDKIIKQMEKRLKLNKKAKIPASFRTDGLDYLLEICQTSSTKDKKLPKDQNKSVEEYDEEDLEGESEEDADINASENEVEDEEMDLDSDENSQDEYSGSESEEESLEAEKTEEGTISNLKNTKEKLAKTKLLKEKDDGTWEDIYGRMRRKDGTIIDGNPKLINENTGMSEAKIVEASVPGKYVPPMQRKNQTQRDKISRTMKGLLNRLSEANMHTISKQIEEAYMENSRNEMNECFLELLYASLLRNVVVPERVILEHVMLIAILHANIGTEIGAFFLQKFVEDFRNKYDSKVNDDSKELENLAMLISAMYHFKVVDACLLYDILKLLSSNFEPKDVELILTILRSVGFRLRKDDPIELKALIILIQQKAAAGKSSSSGAKVKFMLEVVSAIRNNNMSKIPNYDTSVGDHLLKILKAHIHKGSYVSTMKIKMEDLLNAETKGRWWIVGSAWSNSNMMESDRSLSGTDISDFNTSGLTEDKRRNETLLSKARKLGMNTETRKNIFCILMTSEDYVDAFNKLNQLDLKNNQEREIIHVVTYCCLHEKVFNPFYGLIASKFCAVDRKHMLTLQFNIWDRLKDLNSLKTTQLTNLAKLLIHLINDKTLPLSSLKVIEYTEMDKVKLKFLKDILCGILLQQNEDNMQEIFLKSAASDNLSLFRESLRLFMGHFLLEKSVITSDGEDVGCDLDQETMEKLKERVKIADIAMSLGKSRVQF